MTTTTIERPEPMYTVEELCALLRVHEDTVRLLRQQGHIASVKIGTAVRIPAAEVERICTEGARGRGRGRPRRTANTNVSDSN